MIKASRPYLTRNSSGTGTPASRNKYAAPKQNQNGPNPICTAMKMKITLNSSISPWTGRVRRSQHGGLPGEPDQVREGRQDGHHEEGLGGGGGHEEVEDHREEIDQEARREGARAADQL